MRSYTINIIPGYAADPSVRVSQYDKHYPIYFTIMDGDSEKDLTDTTAYFSIKNGQKTIVQKDLSSAIISCIFFLIFVIKEG